MATVTGNAVASEKIRIRLKAYDHVLHTNTKIQENNLK